MRSRSLCCGQPRFSNAQKTASIDLWPEIMTIPGKGSHSTVSGISAATKSIVPSPASRAARLITLFALALASLGTTSGCGYAIGYHVMEPTHVVTQATDETELVTIDSEPRGARITKDGAPAGTTPASLSLEYQIQRHEARGACLLGFSLALVDLATGVATMWAANRWWDRNPVLMGGGALYGGIFFLAGGRYGLGLFRGQERIVTPRPSPSRTRIDARDRWMGRVTHRSDTNRVSESENLHCHPGAAINSTGNEPKSKTPLRPTKTI